MSLSDPGEVLARGNDGEGLLAGEEGVLGMAGGGHGVLRVGFVF